MSKRNVGKILKEGMLEALVDYPEERIPWERPESQLKVTSCRYCNLGKLRHASHCIVLTAAGLLHGYKQLGK